MIPLMALWANPWVRRVALVVVVLIALLSVRAYYINEGKTAGKIDQQQITAVEIEKMRAADRRDTELELAQLQTKIDASAEQARADRAVFISLVGQRQQATQQVQGMTAQQMTELLEHYSQRDLANCVTQLPICNRQVETLKSEAIDKDNEISGRQQQYAQLADYTTGLEGKFTELWNTRSTPRRSWKCMKLWKCDRPQIELPDPAGLHRPQVLSLK